MVGAQRRRRLRASLGRWAINNVIFLDNSHDEAALGLQPRGDEFSLLCVAGASLEVSQAHRHRAPSIGCRNRQYAVRSTRVKHAGYASLAST